MTERLLLYHALHIVGVHEKNWGNGRKGKWNAHWEQIYEALRTYVRADDKLVGWTGHAAKFHRVCDIRKIWKIEYLDMNS